MAELIAIGTTEADSGDFTLASGESATIFLKHAAGPLIDRNVSALIQIKSADDEYFTIGELRREVPAQVLTAVGTFRVHKPSSTQAFGVDKS